MKKYFTLLFVWMFSMQASAQIASWDFTGENQALTSTADFVDQGILAAPILIRGAGAGPSIGLHSFRTTGFKNDGISIANTDYFEFSFSVKADKKCSLTGITAKFAGTTGFYAAPGVSSQSAYSVNGGAFQLVGSPQNTVSATLDNFEIALSGISALQNMVAGTVVAFRYFASGQTTTGGFGFAGKDGLVLNGSVESVGGSGSGTGNHAPALNTLPDVTICYNATPLTLALSGISANDAGQTISLSVSTDNPNLFSDLNVQSTGAGTGVMNYTFRENKVGEATIFLKVKDNGGIANGGVDTLIRSFKIIETEQPTVNEHTIMACLGKQQFLTLKGVSGQAPYTFSYSINHGATLSVTTTGTNDTARIAINTNQTGQFLYKLLSVANATCQTTLNDSVTVTVIAKLTASISGPEDVCFNTASTQITFTATDGRAPFTFHYTINDGEIQSVPANGNERSVSVAVPTSSAGTFTYKLVKVDDYCGSTQLTETFAIIVREQLSGTISGDESVGISDDDLSVIFFASGGAAPYSFFYTVNDGQEQVIRSNDNKAILHVSALNAGNFIYKFIKMNDRTCKVNVNGTATIHIYTLPDATISKGAIACVGGPPLEVFFTAIRGAPPFTFIYRINHGKEINITTSQQIINLPVPVHTAGNFTYTLTEIKDAFGKHALSDSAIFQIQPIPELTISASHINPVSSAEITFLTLHGSSAGFKYAWEGEKIIGSSQDTILKVQPDATSNYLLTATNGAGCKFSLSYTLQVIRRVAVKPTNILTPNNDGLNDQWIIPNIEKHPDNSVRLFSAAGAIVFEAKRYHNTWDGKVNGLPLAEGTYYYIIDLGDKADLVKGFITVIR